MADYFFDTSALAKHYHVETGTAQVDALLGQAGARHFVSALGVVELLSALARLVRTGHLTAVDFQLARGRFLANIASGIWQVIPVAQAHFHAAQQLLARHALSRSMRTLDAIQLAVALDQHHANPLAAFVCADANLCELAATEGLTVINPEAS